MAEFQFNRADFIKEFQFNHADLIKRIDIMDKNRKIMIDSEQWRFDNKIDHLRFNEWPIELQVEFKLRFF